MRTCRAVMPAKAGIQRFARAISDWIPAFAGMTSWRVCATVLLVAITAGAARADVVVAEVAGESVTDRELNSVLSLLPKTARAEILQPDNRRKFVENYLSWKLLVGEAHRRKIDASDEYARRVERAKNEVLLDLLAAALRSEVKVDEAGLKAFYEEHRKDFQVPEKRRARHILVSEEKKASDIIKRLRGGSKFESESKLHSEDRGTAADGGDIGLRMRDDLVPEFSKAVFSMKAGELLDRPLKTRFGWHVIRLEEVSAAREPKWAEIREEVRKRYVNELSLNAIPDLTNRLKAKSRIIIHDDRLPSLGPSP
ncbi:peptidylprolyl isomerase [bacterium]|nr:peptidylprolyl isomerase [bacterium]